MNTSFTEGFQSLTGYPPMRWQCRLFERFIDNEFPDTCDIPTGLGKTSILVVWLLALSRQASRGNVCLPRRLIYVVNRRTVVDQATATVLRIRRRLLEPDHDSWRQHVRALREIATVLQGLCAGGGDPLALSTLRGELADNEEWKADPSRPAIIVGTIDMIGSKVLFSGYGDRRYGRTHHAGLIGQDALIVHDEAHLTPAFSGLLRTLEQEQAREAKCAGDSKPIGRPIRVLDLSATSRGSGTGRSFKLQPDDKEDEIVRDRLDACKLLRLHEAEKGRVVERLADLATAHEEEQTKVLIYVRSPDGAQKIASALKKALGRATDGRIALLTGTIRGHERDRLVETDQVYCALLDHESKVEQTVYLISTSAGEVGIDLDADHMVCDLTTLDSMIQRLGRVNRRGGPGRATQVHLVVESDQDENADSTSELRMAMASTFSLLQRWDKPRSEGIDVSPGNLRRLLEGLDPQELNSALSPEPDSQPLTGILLDAWSLTSIDKMPGRPEVAEYLHGLTHDPPETYVTWRKEVTALHEHEATESSLGDWFDACRVVAREKLRDRTDRVKRGLADLLKGHRKGMPDRDFPVVLLDERGAAKWSRLSDVVDKDFSLAYRTVVLPVEAGGLDVHGMLDARAMEPTPEIDVAEEGTRAARRERWLHIHSPDGEQYERFLTGERVDSLPQDLREQERVILMESESAEHGGEALDLLLMVPPRTSARAQQTLTDHTDSITERMTRIVERMGLKESIQVALIEAARWHDRGKDRPVWQRYACRPQETESLAKSMNYLHSRALGGYRHEFGSLLEAMGDGGLQTHYERDLILHLIAAHHGWARPHFETRSFDQTYTTATNVEAATETMRRFGRLQDRFGRWGLAWLESLLRCADIAASRESAELATVPQPQEVGT